MTKATAMFDQVDQDGDGELDEHEFIRSLSFNPSLLFPFWHIFLFSSPHSITLFPISLIPTFPLFVFPFSFRISPFHRLLLLLTLLLPPRGCLRDPDFVLILNAPGVDPEEWDDE